MNEHVFSRVQFLKTVFSPVTRFWPPPCTHADREREGEGEGESESLSWLISQGRDEIERQQIIWINVKKSPKTHCVSVYTVSTTSSPVDFKSGTRYEENQTLPQTSACGISEIRIPSIFRARFSLVICPNAGRTTDFLRQKIERFFWRDFSGEEFREQHYCPTTLFSLLGCGVDSFSPN